LLEQCASAGGGELNAERVYSCLGIAGIQECGKLMAHIADHDTSGALAVMNRLYADGKDMGALMDELACLTRDFMVLKTAPKEGIALLSGVASDEEVKALYNRFSSGELLRMLNLIQQTVAGFSKSESRRMEAELCIVNLCQPELETDMDALIARLTRMEDQLRSGMITFQAAPSANATAPVQEADSEKEPEAPAAVVAEKLDSAPNVEDQAPVGFWTDVATAVKKELSPSMCGFFATTPNAPLRGVLNEDKLYLVCSNKFVMDIINKPEVLELVVRKASAMVGKPLRIVITDQTYTPQNTNYMDQLLDFGRAHSGVINIKE
jgi:DNA polymerase-3 subunit gamma/tau